MTTNSIFFPRLIIAFRSRLSSYASKQMMDGNPNITDLSDQNRPTKIGERFASLYDEEWSEAFDAVTTQFKRREDETVSLLLRVVLVREKGRDLTQSYDKNPYTTRKIQKATRQYKNATKNIDYTTIADRLRTVSSGNDNHPTCSLNRFTGFQPFH